MPTMDELVRALADARAAKERAESDAKMIQLEIDLKYGAALDLIKGWIEQAEAKEKEADEALRAAALLEYEATGEKQVHPAVQVKVYTTLEYDEKQAIGYCREHLPKALRLDRRAFEKAARAYEPSFVTFVVEPRAQVASDLSAYVGES